MNIDAIILSVDEPQLPRCIAAVEKQGFFNVVHVKGVVPEHEAFNQAMALTKGEWAIHLAGDIILYDDAYSIIEDSIRRYDQDNVCAVFFGLYDPFLDIVTGYGNVLKTCVYKALQYKNSLLNDRKANNEVRSRGFIIKKLDQTVIGTHFDQPDEFQVFHRFYTQNVKFKNKDSDFVCGRMTELYERTGNPLYQTGLKAIEFARKKRVYPGSHNREFDLELYKEFKREG
jgi:hypothetical protein